MSAPYVPALKQQQDVRVGLKMVAANEMRNGMEDFGREVLHGKHVDCAKQTQVKARMASYLELQSDYEDIRIDTI